jgi:hypothetical protein
MKTPMKLLFEEFETLSKNMRFAGDTPSANLIDYLCERKDVAIIAETEYINKIKNKNE